MSFVEYDGARRYHDEDEPEDGNCEGVHVLSQDDNDVGPTEEEGAHKRDEEADERSDKPQIPQTDKTRIKTPLYTSMVYVLVCRL